MNARSRGVPVALGLGALLLSSCALPQRMERGVPGATSCPAIASPSTAVASNEGLVWYRESTQRDRELAAAWCATVGDPVLELAPSAPSSWDSGEALQVISWNMWVGGGALYRLLHDELGVNCMSEGTPGEGSAPFVVLLQEVWRASGDLPVVGSSRIIPWTIDPGRTEGEDADIVAAARGCGLSLVYVPSARNGPDTGSRPGEDKGNAILSNLPLRDPIAFDLPLEGGRKVAVAATVQGPGGRALRVVTSHLDVASTLVRTMLSGNQTRLRQAMGLVDGLARAEADGYEVDATLVGADMNTWVGNEAALKAMWRAFPESPEWDGLGTRAGMPTDHIFFRAEPASGFTVDGYGRVEERYASDHHPRRVLVSPGASQ